MANEVVLLQSCGACNGTGIDTHTVPDGQGGETVIEQACANCGATGKVELGEISGGYFDDVISKLGDLETKIDEIKAVVDAL